jgi:hypothetical protein
MFSSFAPMKPTEEVAPERLRLTRASVRSAGTVFGLSSVPVIFQDCVSPRLTRKFNPLPGAAVPLTSYMPSCDSTLFR